MPARRRAKPAVRVSGTMDGYGLAARWDVAVNVVVPRRNRVGRCSYDQIGRRPLRHHGHGTSDDDYRDQDVPERCHRILLVGLGGRTWVLWLLPIVWRRAELKSQALANLKNNRLRPIFRG